MIEAIKEKIAQNRFEFSQHAVDQSIPRRISVQELRQTALVGEIIHYRTVFCEPKRWVR